MEALEEPGRIAAGTSDRGRIQGKGLNPGRPRISAGPDFRDALLEIEGLGLVRGDVELPLRQRDRAAHGHSSDPNYNGVVVHGGRAPMLSLDSLLAVSSPEEDPAPKLDLWPLLSQHRFAKPETTEEAGELLDRAGDQRFLREASAFRRFINEQGPDKTLHEALMEGLGYRHNRQPSLRLAYLALYSALKRAADRLPEGASVDFIASWLLGVSGLGEPFNGAERPRPPGLRRTMAKAQWHLFRVRPFNHPVVRISDEGVLIDRYLVPGLVDGLNEAAKAVDPRFSPMR